MNWDPDFTTRNAIVGQLAGLVAFTDPEWPSLASLNRHLASGLGLHFVDNDTVAARDCYYEEAVAQGQVPTRQGNWHDFFGAVIWHLFPQTKALLNRLHMEHIHAHGARTRTPRRDRITHFDECGLVLAVPEGDEMETLLSQHHWQRLFLERRRQWGNDWQPFIFGHALYEQALHPFIGLTAKAVVLPMPDGFFALPRHEQYSVLDNHLCEQLQARALFDRPRPLRPLPLLGIPGWWPANEDPGFYHNTDYFRPCRQG
ncbi:hypothetical protein GU3_09570 [Oceanimonas sp. GK1]|uniref:DUF3025 domain-containing protein n=1 Tax=Oceanimonas sp. (strain GK1 / IBRC-M 10197) TaxID=511062 RepID=UPI0002494E45|nr:DUF3025 domain-containing protein [Oceanimonas sp. GK1]AEY01670.1 hypothetical protein GU3_09570 [Oceanimonas sp. GK1]